MLTWCRYAWWILLLQMYKSADEIPEGVDNGGLVERTNKKKKVNGQRAERFKVIFKFDEILFPDSER